MNKLLGIFLLALAFLAPGTAQAANRWAVCATTCTWNNDGVTTGIMWSSIGSGGATGAAAPTSGDTAIFDAATCVGGVTCTITTFAGTISAASIAWGACTASTTGCIIDASVNNTNFTLAASTGSMLAGTGTGTRKWLGGTGTYTLTRSSSASCINNLTVTNDTGTTFAGATITCSGTTANGGLFNLGGFSYGAVTLNGNTSGGGTTLTGSNAFASLTINAPTNITLPVGNTQTISGALTLNGSSASSIVNLGVNQDPASGTVTISIGSASTGSFALLRNITTTGAGALTVSNCFSAGQLTLANGGACNAPSGGGSGRIIGG